MEKITEEEQRLFNLIKAILPKEPIGWNQYMCAKYCKVNSGQFRAAIRKMRKMGVPICSSVKGGYWITEEADEIKDLIEYYYAYINSMQHTVSQLKISYHKAIAKENRNPFLYIQKPLVDEV